MILDTLHIGLGLAVLAALALAAYLRQASGPELARLRAELESERAERASDQAERDAARARADAA
jgi:hypothetical protein